MTESSHIAYLALGSNLGDRSAILESAVAMLRQTAGIKKVEAISRFVETAPIGLPGQGPYLNAAVKVQTELSPRQLLESALAIEQAHGRDRSQQQRWGPRLLDIDVLLFDEQIIDETGPPRLRIPHPHMTERLFVLHPLAEIAPQAVHPNTGLTVQCHLDRLVSSQQMEYPNSSACFRP